MIVGLICSGFCCLYVTTSFLANSSKVHFHTWAMLVFWSQVIVSLHALGFSLWYGCSGLHFALPEVMHYKKKKKLC